MMTTMDMMVNEDDENDGNKDDKNYWAACQAGIAWF